MGERPKRSTHHEPALGRDAPEGLARALAWLNGQLEEPVQLETLAAIAGVRPRTLEAQFKRHLRTTPLGWTRRLRLARARQKLLSAPDSATVTDAAMATGFAQLGRFAAYYRRQFGELPSQTLRTARTGHGDGGNDDDEALRLSWRAMASAFGVGPAACQAALADVEQARELAPHLALPKAIAAWCLSQRAAHNFSRTPQLDLAQAGRLAGEARKLAPHDALSLSL